MKTSNSKITKYFIDDAITVGVSLVTIVLTWLMGLGWTFDKIIPVHDGISMGYVLYKELVARGGHIANTLYSASWKGGSKLFEIANYPYDLQLFAWLDFSPQTMTNLHTFFIQFLCVILSLIITRNILNFLTEKKFLLSIPEKIFSVILTGFTPIIAWRLGMGHDIIVMGALAFLGGVAILTCSLTDSWSEIGAAIIIATFAFIFQSVGQQTLVYSIVFGLPFFILIISLDYRKTLFNRNAFILTALVLFTALGLSLTKFWPFLQNAIGTDAVRELGGQTLTYSYITATLEDWFCSIFWSKTWIPYSRGEGLYHEVHYGLGPLLLLIFLFPFKKTIKFHMATMFSIVMAVVFSMDIAPFSDFLLDLLPILKSFRVPERSIFSVGLILPILGLSTIYYWLRNDEIKIPLRDWFFGFIIGALILFVPDDSREFLYWGLSLGLIASHYFFKNIFKKIIIYSLPILALGSMSYFKEKLFPFQSEAQFNTQLVQLGEFIKTQDVSLKDPLNRVHIEGRAPLFAVNTSKAAMLSSLDGYWFQPSRFTFIMAALQNRKSNPTEIFHAFDTRTPDFPILQQLYNVQSKVRFEQGRPRVERIGPTLGAAWFSNKITEVAGFTELSNELKKSSLIDQLLKEDTYIVKTDPVFATRPVPKVEGLCVGSSVKSVMPVNFDQDFILEVQSNGSCPVVIATTFVSDFKAIVMEGSLKDAELEVFPANGSLVGILVPSQVSKILLKADLEVPLWCKVIYFFSFITFFGILIFIRKINFKELS